MAKSWFPGHMKKAIDEIMEYLKLINVVIEVVDARAPNASSNPNLQKLLGGKPKVIALNKADLADSYITREWIKNLSNNDQVVIECNFNTGEGVAKVIKEAKRLAMDTMKKNSMISNIKVRALVVGLPNVGKSSFINRTAKKVKAKVADKPGVTRTKQWILVDTHMELLDTPGIMPPRIDSISIWFCLCLLGIIGDKLLEHEALAFSLIEVCEELYPKALCEKYGISDDLKEPADIFEAIGVRRGLLRAGGIVDMQKTAEVLLKDFKQGQIGKMSLERPDVEVDYEKYVNKYFANLSIDEESF